MNADEFLERRQSLPGLPSQETVARILGVATNTVARWEQGVSPIPGPVELAMRQIADSLELPNGRHIEVKRTGFSAQPPNDNYWAEFPSIEAAREWYTSGGPAWSETISQYQR